MANKIIKYNLTAEGTIPTHIADGGYYPKANNYFGQVGDGHQLRYDSRLAADSWAKNDPISGGTAYYWTRFRIESAIDFAPVFEQLKLHTNRFEINDDGWIEYFGKARPIGQLALSLAQGKPFDGVMANQNLYVSQNIGVGGSDNTFNSTDDKMGINGFLPFDCDTSSPLRLVWSGRPNGTGTYGWTVRWAWVNDGDALVSGNPAVPTTNSRSLIISKAATVDKKVTFETIVK